MLSHWPSKDRSSFFHVVYLFVFFFIVIFWCCTCSDEPSCIEGKIMSRYLDARLTVCQCSFGENFEVILNLEAQCEFFMKCCFMLSPATNVFLPPSPGIPICVSPFLWWLYQYIIWQVLYIFAYLYVVWLKEFVLLLSVKDDWKCFLFPSECCKIR